LSTVSPATTLHQKQTFNHELQLPQKRKPCCPNVTNESICNASCATLQCSTDGHGPSDTLAPPKELVAQAIMIADQLPTQEAPLCS
jgi:hypothetical protein